MKINNRCYECTTSNPRWRGPKLGWLCLRCFAEGTKPVVRVAPPGGWAPDSINATERDSPFVVDEGDAGWALYIHTSDRAFRRPTRYHLGRDFDAEGAVDEAKWFLNKRAYERALKRETK